VTDATAGFDAAITNPRKITSSTVVAHSDRVLAVA